MTFANASLLLAVMLVLAAIPSASVALVVTRSATLGIANGVAVAAGIVLADLVFVALAVLGMGFLAEAMGSFFAVLRVAAGGYLVWLGVSLLRSPGPVAPEPTRPSRASLLASFTAGFGLTLGDVKAILFYASLFPAFVDMARLTAGDLAGIVVVTILAVGGVKVAYAVLARRIVDGVRHPRAQGFARKAAGCAMVGAGTFLIVKG